MQLRQCIGDATVTMANDATVYILGGVHMAHEARVMVVGN